MKELIQKDLSNQVLKSFYKDYNTLGYGFLEKVYENALVIELKNSGLKVEKQKQIKVFYKDISVGDYFADIIVEDALILS